MQDISKDNGRTVLFVSHNMASVKALCTNSMVLKDGRLLFLGNTAEGIFYYQNQSLEISKPKMSWTLKNAPGNNKIKVLSIEALPAQGNYLTIESGVILKIEFYNFSEGINLDITMELVTKEEVIVFHRGTIISKNKDSKIGIYVATVNIPAFLLNANTYKVNLIFGEMQRYLLYNIKDIYAFEIENSNAAQGSNMRRTPGVIRPVLNWTAQYWGTKESVPGND